MPIARHTFLSTRLPHPDQNETGSVRKKNNMPPARPASKPFRQPIILVADRLGAGSCQLPHGSELVHSAWPPYTVCWILGGVGHGEAGKCGRVRCVVRIPLPDSRNFLDLPFFCHNPLLIIPRLRLQPYNHSAFETSPTPHNNCGCPLALHYATRYERITCQTYTLLTGVTDM